MATRRRMSRKQSKRQFRRGVKRSHKRNRPGYTGSYWLRGGVRF